MFSSMQSDIVYTFLHCLPRDEQDLLMIEEGEHAPGENVLSGTSCLVKQTNIHTYIHTHTYIHVHRGRKINSGTQRWEVESGADIQPIRRDPLCCDTTCKRPGA